MNAVVLFAACLVLLCAVYWYSSQAAYWRNRCSDIEAGHRSAPPQRDWTPPAPVWLTEPPYTGESFNVDGEWCAIGTQPPPRGHHVPRLGPQRHCGQVIELLVGEWPAAYGGATVELPVVST